ncbi:V-type ATP synthase subunit D [Salinicola sp. V024]|uniref:V-type ATP synthase subunit D n=1 Tax=Salinicola sp. V024 TaxID=3459609 RepID=UPI0040444DBE
MPALNKSSLSQLKQQRTMYQRYLPALEMKQRMLLAQRKMTEQHLSELRLQIEEMQTAIGRELPMLADTRVSLEGLISVETLRIDEENVVGVTLPRLNTLTIERRPYSLLSHPHWIDQVVARLENMLRLKVAARILEQRLMLIDKAARIVTQRVNLFSKVKIPETVHAIQRIDLYLADQERAAVVRAKLAKRKLAQT